eukprot:3296003-Rhodomonas_salina.3
MCVSLIVCPIFTCSRDVVQVSVFQAPFPWKACTVDPDAVVQQLFHGQDGVRIKASLPGCPAGSGCHVHQTLSKGCWDHPDARPQ